MRKPVQDVLATTAELFQNNLNQHYFSLETPDETKTARLLEKKFLTFEGHFKVLHDPSMHKQLKDKDSRFLKKYDKTLQDFKELAKDCTGNIKTTALCLGYFYETALSHDVFVQPHVPARKGNVFNTYFKKVEKMLFQTVDTCHPARHERYLWNAKNFALTAYSTAKHKREHPMTREEYSALAERLLSDKGPMPPS